MKKMTVVDQDLAKISNAEVKRALKRMKRGRQLVLMIYLWSYGSVSER